MSFEYNWENKEANFGPPLKKQTDGGLHITIEIILKKDGKYIALRRPGAIPGHEHPPKPKTSKGLLYFCHNLIRYAEPFDVCVKRIVKEQSGASVKSFKVIEITSEFQKKDGQWSFMPYVIVELKTLPKSGTHGNKVTEVVVFDKANVPKDFGWWEKNEVEDFLNEYD